MPIKADWYSFDHVKLAPKTSGVYEIGYKSNGLVVYIGESGRSIRSRLVLHTKRRDIVNATHFRFRKTRESESAEQRLLL
jgi:excinuclease UvrABC nuclease subunit